MPNNIFYIHGTNSKILALLPKTGFKMFSALDMALEHGVAPASGEIDLGGYTGIKSNCQPCFSILPRTDITRNYYSLDQILKYTKENTDSLIERKRNTSFNVMLINLIRKINYGLADAQDILKEAQNLQGEWTDLKNYYTFLKSIIEQKQEIQISTLEHNDSEANIFKCVEKLSSISELELNNSVANISKSYFFKRNTEWVSDMLSDRYSYSALRVDYRNFPENSVEEIDQIIQAINTRLNLIEKILNQQIASIQFSAEENFYLQKKFPLIFLVNTSHGKIESEIEDKELTEQNLIVKNLRTEFRLLQLEVNKHVDIMAVSCIKDALILNKFLEKHEIRSKITLFSELNTADQQPLYDIRVLDFIAINSSQSQAFFHMIACLGIAAIISAIELSPLNTSILLMPPGFNLVLAVGLCILGGYYHYTVHAIFESSTVDSKKSILHQFQNQSDNSMMEEQKSRLYLEQQLGI